jgi:hypothetical protein
MKKKISTLVISSLGLMALASGCTMEAVETEALGTEELEAQVCSNDQATNALIASMAVVMAREVGGWNPKTDLAKVFVNPDGWNREVVALTTTAKNKCSARGYGQCTVLQGLLNLQTSGAGMQFGGAQLTDANVLRSRMLSYYDSQKTCIDDTTRNGDQNQPQQCPGESNSLVKYKDSMSGSTCAGGKDYWYKATYAGTSTPLNATDSAQLKNNLKWAGGSQNPYLAFETDPAVAGDVKIDPLDGTTGGGSSGSGSCEAAMNPVMVNNAWKCDNSNEMAKLNACCTCGGQQRSWKAAFQSGFVACKL